MPTPYDLCTATHVLATNLDALFRHVFPDIIRRPVAIPNMNNCGLSVFSACRPPPSDGLMWVFEILHLYNKT